MTTTSTARHAATIGRQADHLNSLHAALENARDSGDKAATKAAQAALDAALKASRQAPNRLSQAERLADIKSLLAVIAVGAEELAEDDPRGRFQDLMDLRTGLLELAARRFQADNTSEAEAQALALDIGRSITRGGR